MESKKAPRLHLAVDVEKKGATFHHPVIQVGVAWGTSLNDIQKRSFCFDYKDQPFEKRCWDEFWSKYENVYSRICAEAAPPVAQWKKFSDFLQELEEKSEKLDIVSDNPAYDVEAIDYNLHTYLGRAGIRYSSTMGYRRVHDASEMIKGLPSHYGDLIVKKAQSSARATHWAADDAEYILTHFFLVKGVIECMREAEDKIRKLTEATHLQ